MYRARMTDLFALLATEAHKSTIDWNSVVFVLVVVVLVLGAWWLWTHRGRAR